MKCYVSEEFSNFVKSQQCSQLFIESGLFVKTVDIELIGVLWHQLYHFLCHDYHVLLLPMLKILSSITQLASLSVHNTLNA